MSRPEILDALSPGVEALDALGVSYFVVGSVASSALGVPRSTLDADIVADLPGKKIDALFAALERDYYLDRDAMVDAVRRRSMFNAIHLGTMLKVDVYIVTSRPFDVESFARRRPGTLHVADRPYVLATPEDTILHKREWYRIGGGVSDRQWGDVVGVLKVQIGALDLQYLNAWAVRLGVEDLLARATAEAAAEGRQLEVKLGDPERGVIRGGASPSRCRSTP